ncbi:Benzylsuccinate synthase activating enzyme [Georgfuchsia toluolica]|uniref:Benzylsuccinate synthase activating enzyme n=1 Tax=Georgfuchsia toluolica TaxID=424218 RepID=A0A916J455_9PROT|nr:[benzylsuccinate synthase]-activating enzyme [Georgfuchsia toluolica]CAG4882137.1 Benzylsuccinate synthase activating enzyme [Georgfuchsia toluolica]CAG4885445.1 Benzylsuccinate synthase activating enzyme [Georgfuchsia toluolica]
MKIPLITEIQRFSLQDGPGFRTTVFLKGCPLKCPWCHNPETQRPTKEFYYNQARCVSCGRCVAVCPSGASSLVQGPGKDLVLQLDRSKCINCMRCVAVCLTEARESVGKTMSMEDILQEVLSDEPFYRNSGGGVTISGGDPLLYPAFTLGLAKRIKQRNVHVAIETSCFPKSWKTIQPLLNFVDLFIVDLKSMNPQKHADVIGWPLKPILDNIERLIESHAHVRIHIPVIPGFNDSQQDFDDYIAYLSQYSKQLEGVDILNYHVYGEGKYISLGREKEYQYMGVKENPPEKVLPLARGLKLAGISSVTIGGLVGITESRNTSSRDAGMQCVA